MVQEDVYLKFIEHLSILGYRQTRTSHCKYWTTSRVVNAIFRLKFNFEEQQQRAKRIQLA